MPDMLFYQANKHKDIIFKRTFNPTTIQFMGHNFRTPMEEFAEIRILSKHLFIKAKADLDAKEKRASHVNLHCWPC